MVELPHVLSILSAAETLSHVFLECDVAEEDIQQLRNEVKDVVLYFVYPSGSWEPLGAYDKEKVYVTLRDICWKHGYSLAAPHLLVERNPNIAEMTAISDAHQFLRATAIRSPPHSKERIAFLSYMLAYWKEGCWYY